MAEKKKQVSPAYNSDYAKKFRNYRNDYAKNNYKQILLRFNKTTRSGRGYIKWLEEQENIHEYIRDLIETDMLRQGIDPETYDD
jgi:hypothetical protein